MLVCKDQKVIFIDTLDLLFQIAYFLTIFLYSPDIIKFLTIFLYVLSGTPGTPGFNGGPGFTGDQGIY